MPIVIQRRREPTGLDQLGKGMIDAVQTYLQGSTQLANQQYAHNKDMFNFALQDKRLNDQNRRDDLRWSEMSARDDKKFERQMTLQEMSMANQRALAQQRMGGDGGAPAANDFHVAAARAKAKLESGQPLSSDDKLAIGISDHLLKMTGKGGSQVGFSDVNALGKRFTDESKGFANMSDSLTRLITGTKADNAPGDMAAVFSYMKMLDPTSVVREAEYATAENARGVPDSIRNMYNKAINGERLTQEQRKSFVSVGRQLWDEQKKNHDIRIPYFENVARENGIDPSFVIQDFVSPVQNLTNDYDGYVNSPPLNTQPTMAPGVYPKDESMGTQSLQPHQQSVLGQTPSPPVQGFMGQSAPVPQQGALGTPAAPASLAAGNYVFNPQTGNFEPKPVTPAFAYGY